MDGCPKVITHKRPNLIPPKPNKCEKILRCTLTTFPVIDPILVNFSIVSPGMFRVRRTDEIHQILIGPIYTVRVLPFFDPVAIQLYLQEYNTCPLPG